MTRGRLLTSLIGAAALTTAALTVSPGAAAATADSQITVPANPGKVSVSWNDTAPFNNNQDGLVYGQLGLDDGALVAGVEAQTTQALVNLRTLLEGEGASLADVVKTTVFLRHMDDFETMNRAYVEAFGDHRPARSAIAVAGLPRGALVEVEAWARVGS